MTSTGMRPWLPPSLREHELTAESVTRLSYIVVDEIVGAVAALAVYPWPQADKEGRLRFDLENCRHVAVSLRALNTQLCRKLTEREARVGDVFGAELADVAQKWLDARKEEAIWSRALGLFLQGDVYDLSLDARLVAKLAYYAAMTPVLAERHVEHWNLAEKTQPPAEEAKTVNLGGDQKAESDA